MVLSQLSADLTCLQCHSISHWQRCIKLKTNKTTKKGAVSASRGRLKCRSKQAFGAEKSGRPALATAKAGAGERQRESIRTSRTLPIIIHECVSHNLHKFIVLRAARPHQTISVCSFLPFWPATRLEARALSHSTQRARYCHSFMCIVPAHSPPSHFEHRVPVR